MVLLNEYEVGPTARDVCLRRLVEVGISLPCVVYVCLAAAGRSRHIPAMCGICLFGGGW